MAKKLAISETQKFMAFVREQGVVGMAVGLAIGIAAAGAVSDVVDGFVSPLVGFLLAGTDLTDITWTTGLSRVGEDLVFGWGAALNGILRLLATALIIYLIVHKFRLDRIDKVKE